MLRRLVRREKPPEFPAYSGLSSIPTRALPPELADEESSESFRARKNDLGNGLLEDATRPRTDAPLLVGLATKAPGVLTLRVPKGSKCLLAFTSAPKATDYARTALDSGTRTDGILLWSPERFIALLQEMEPEGVKSFAFDRCPRCSVLATFGSQSMKSADDVVVVWSIHKSSELARAELYFTYALKSARAGQFTSARDVALEAVGHVTMEDPRLHLLLGQLAVELSDGTLLREALRFLEFFHLEPWRAKLEQISRSGSPDFALSDLSG